MLGKILLTITVALLAFVVLRQRHLAEKKEESGQADPGPARPPAADSGGDSLSSDLRIAAYLFLILMVGTGAALYYVRWQDDRTLLTITLHRDGEQTPVTYEVYKYQLGERSFTTTDGRVVTVAASERMVIEGLED